jgi:hypothetical protein
LSPKTLPFANPSAFRNPPMGDMDQCDDQAAARETR